MKLLIAKMYSWDCRRRNQTLPTIVGFKAKIKLKYATEAVHCTKSNKVKQGLLSKICTIENMGELYSVILLLVLLLFYVYRTDIYFVFRPL